MNQLAHLARILKTGLAFVLFGVGGLLIGLVAFPILYVTSNPTNRVGRSRTLVGGCFRLFILILKWLGLLTFRLNGIEKIRGPSLVVANHPSLIDVILLCGWLRKPNCIVKPELYKNLFTVGPVVSAGYINSDAENVADLVEGALQGDEVIVVFPEGTRTVPGHPLKFRRGAAHLSLRFNVPIHPVSIVVQPTTLTKAESWWQVPAAKPHFELTVHDAWETSAYDASGVPSQQARHLTRDLQDFLTAQTNF